MKVADTREIDCICDTLVPAWDVWWKVTCGDCGTPCAECGERVEETNEDGYCHDCGDE